MLRLLKSNVPKLVWHHGTSVYWKIAALIVGSAEIQWVFYPGVRFAPPCSIWALHTTYVCMYVYMHAYIQASTFTLAQCFLGLSGQVRPQVSIFYWPGRPIYFQIVFIPLVTATGHRFNGFLPLPSTPALQLNTSFISI